MICRWSLYWGTKEIRVRNPNWFWMEKQMQTQTMIQFPMYMHKLLTVFVSHLQVYSLFNTNWFMSESLRKDIRITWHLQDLSQGWIKSKSVVVTVIHHYNNYSTTDEVCTQLASSASWEALYLLDKWQVHIYMSSVMIKSIVPYFFGLWGSILQLFLYPFLDYEAVYYNYSYADYQ